MQKRFFNISCLLLITFSSIFLKIQGYSFFYKARYVAKVFKKLRRKKCSQKFYHQSNTPYFSENTKLLFSPHDDIANHIISLISKEKKSIKMAMFIFTHHGIAKSLVYAAKCGVKVEVIVDKAGLEYGATINYLKKNGIAVLVYDQPDHIMHDKSIIFESENIAAFGSCNFTKRAMEKNCEHFVITSYATVLDKLKEEFERLKNLLTPS